MAVARVPANQTTVAHTADAALPLSSLSLYIAYCTKHVNRVLQKNTCLGITFSEMENQEETYRQLDFFHLLPGSAGGRALRALKGDDYFAELARVAALNRSQEERQEMSRKRACTRRRRLYTLPRTVCFIEAGCSITERIVPYWPHQKNRRHRKRPIFVHIELDCVRLDN